MKNFILFATSLLALALAGCTRNQEIEVPEANLSLFARTESPTDTKTVVESGVHVYWEPGDEIAVFMGEKSAKFTTDITASSASATFKGTFGDSTWPESIDLWAVYPFSEDAAFDGETITTTLPSEQMARDGSFGKDMNFAIAHSNSSTLQFYNVGGGIRFTVTEEGIKKVMFEGLSGEIISGKVKIGLEDGLPVVREITGGSQFITLLPPAGKETFEKDVWYYIVAIPGALEGGYKLRFYKDADYARKVSEKAVTIKRSIYGNIEKADEGIEYEAQTTHFPRTEEEMIESNQIVMEVASSISHLVQNDDNLSPQELSESILAIDGVLDAELNEDESAIIIMQKDSSYVNYLLRFDETDYTSLISTTTINLPSVSTSPIYNKARSKSINKASIVNQDEMVVPSNKSAILISPFQSDFNVNITFLEEALSAAGYSLDPPYLENDATLDVFNINNLCKYGIVLIRTHGLADVKTNHGEITTAFVTRSPISSGVLKKTKWAKLSRCIVDVNQSFYCMTVPWMEDCATESTSFDNALVFAGDCEGMKNDDMRKCFFKYGAAVCCGFSDVVAHGTANFAMFRYINLLASGAGSRYSHADAELSQDALDYQTYMEDNHVQNGTQLRTLFRSYVNPNLNITDLYLNDLFPKGLTYNVNGSSVSLKWWSDSVRNLDIDHIDNYDYPMPYLKLELRYSVFIDGKNVARDITENNFTKESLEVGQHSWYVISEVINDGELCDTFRSDGEPFTVEEPHLSTPEAIDLGLPSGLKWASFNLGATKPEEYGDFYAWGETKPKDVYNEEEYEWCVGHINELTKYCTDSKYGDNGFTDGKTVLDPEDDAAHVNLGGKWRMPTDTEWTELREQCTWTWTTINGVNGRKVTGPNGNSIFIPASGWRSAYTFTLRGSYGYLWSSSLTNYSSNAFALRFTSDDVTRQYYERYHGLSIRPVLGGPFQAVESVSLNQTELRLSIGEPSTLVATVLPTNATDKSVSWSSSNTTVATVSSDGLVTGVSVGSAIITVTTTDGGKTATCRVTVTGTSTLTAVDLGLSVKWASCNLGAILPEEYGDYYAWGETEPKNDYSWSTYKWCKGENQMTKYSINSSYGYNGFTDGKTILDPEDDAAYVNLGGEWRMPTKAEQDELRDSCVWEWVSINGVYGQRVTGPSGNSIFLPATGYRDRTNLNNVGTDGQYWCSLLCEDRPNSAFYLYVYPQNVYWNNYDRCCGFSIRPVYAE